MIKTNLLTSQVKKQRDHAELIHCFDDEREPWAMYARLDAVSGEDALLQLPAFMKIQSCRRGPSGSQPGGYLGPCTSQQTPIPRC